MKRFLLSVTFTLKLSVLLFSGFAQAGTPIQPIDLGGLECNWGILTMNAIVLQDFDQGDHASGIDVPRDGLPNAVSDDPNLIATCNLVGCGIGVITDPEVCDPD